MLEIHGDTELSNMESFNPKYVAIVIIDVYDVVIFIIFCMNDIHIAKSFLLSVSVVEAS